jgi:hypothetical protein
MAPTVQGRMPFRFAKKNDRPARAGDLAGQRYQKPVSGGRDNDGEE